MQNFSIRAESKVRGMDDAAPLFPIGADSIGILGHFQAIADGKRCARTLDHLFCLVERIHRERDNIDTFFLEFFDMSLVVSDLPNAVGSPDAAVIDDDRVFAFEIGRNIEPATVGDLHVEARERIAGI